MNTAGIFVGDTRLKSVDQPVHGEFVKVDGQTFYKIENFDHMPPFFMSLVSHSDHWLFVSSSGGLSAGREDEDSSLFPYSTDDKITSGYHNTGPYTAIRLQRGAREFLWEPFSDRYPGAYEVTRSLYKNTIGNQLIFEEINHDLKLVFRYSWSFSEEYGFVRTSELENGSQESVNLVVLDGLRNILPYGVSSNLQNVRSNLSNAYKRSELDTASGIGIFALSSMIVDKAEPSEALGASIAWTYGILPDVTLLSTKQLDRFRRGQSLNTETDVKAEPGAYMVSSHLEVEGGSSRQWFILSDVNMDHSGIAYIRNLIRQEANLQQMIIDDIETGSKELRAIVAQADGLQLTADKMSTARHYSNVLFNVMRGGIFEDQYLVYRDDLLDYFTVANKRVVEEHRSFFHGLPETFSYQHLIGHVHTHNDPDLIRLAYEYLPLSFSRRHGDPSRPWNRFRIDGKNEEGRRNKYYEGNWRDIFQNWEALALSFPDFVVSMITKFVDASTIDGYNPYRITRDGIDWEIIEPDDPWSYIGYWGDHQIIYLLKLLEILRAHYPGELKELFTQEHFVFANVPYRIRAYNAMVADPQDTIDFAHEVESQVESLVGKIGSDGKLIHIDGKLLRVNLVEKLLLTLLTKVSNFIPDAGIWLNTQRPEWNDANNALVGNGVSMVTLCYMYRYVTFMASLFDDEHQHSVTEPLATLFGEINTTLEDYLAGVSSGFSDAKRREFVDRLGLSGDRYRFSVYGHPVNERDTINAGEIRSFLELCQEYFKATIQTNKREDGLYHAYNLAFFGKDELRVERLYEMLEGQVAVLSASLLDTTEVADLLDSLKASGIYREDQYSYMLYPNRELPGFLQKNRVPLEFISNSRLAAQMGLDDDRSILQKDLDGQYYFHRDFHNADDLKAALDTLKLSYPKLVESEYQNYLDVFEEIFNHNAFTGRSGTFYGYEGLGSIYWHMVSKLLLAVQENIVAAPEGHPARGRLIDHYYEIRAGIGAHKTPDLYGSFPFDPYSHTPWGKGVQQPGMTGQVKEDIINRWAEFGVCVKNGSIVFAPSFLSEDEYLDTEREFQYVDIHGEDIKIELSAGQLAFTYCQVPVVFDRNRQSGIDVHLASGESRDIANNVLTEELATQIFQRTGTVVKLVVGV